jgi:hypothetical protein
MDAARTSPNDHEVTTPVVVPGVAARQIAPDIAEVSETMLWALHNRASEARRRDGILVDPDCVRIHEAIDYDFERQFGDPVGSLAVRAAEIDRVYGGGSSTIRTGSLCLSVRVSKRRFGALTTAECTGCPWICPTRSGCGSAFSRRPTVSAISP